MAESLPPYDGTPETLYEISVELRSGDVPQTTLKQSNNVSVEGSTARLNIDYGIKLGFLERDDNNHVSATERGFGLAWSGGPNSSNDVQELFRDAVADFDSYSSMIKSLAEMSLDTVKDEKCITQSQVQELLQDIYDEDLDERVSKAAANTFLRTLEVAGLGDYIIGRGGYETRHVPRTDIETYFEDLIDFSDTDEETSELDDTELISEERTVNEQATHIHTTISEELSDIIEEKEIREINIHMHYHSESLPVDELAEWDTKVED